LSLLLQLQRKLEAADSRAGAAAAQVSELKQQLGRAEDQIVELEGHVCVLEDELARRSGLPQ
jgi:chromosome segregation ATPase